MKRSAPTVSFEDIEMHCAEAREYLCLIQKFVSSSVENTNRIIGIIRHELFKLRRRELGLEHDSVLSEAERSPIKKRAKKIAYAILAGKELSADDRRDISRKEQHLLAFAESIKLVTVQRERIELEMRRLYRKFPNAAWRKTNAKGLGELALCVAVGASGNWEHYPGIRSLWKRLGKAPYEKNGVTRSCATWRRAGKLGLTAAEWKDRENGPKYSPVRASTLYGYIAGPLLRQQWRGVDEKKRPGVPAHAIGPYGELYGRYKARITALNEQGAYVDEAVRLVEEAYAKGFEPAKENLEGRLTPKHIHNRAVTYMVKEALKDALYAWKAGMEEWRRSKDPLKAMVGMADAPSSRLYRQEEILSVTLA